VIQVPSSGYDSPDGSLARNGRGKVTPSAVREGRHQPLAIFWRITSREGSDPTTPGKKPGSRFRPTEPVRRYLRWRIWGRRDLGRPWSRSNPCVAD